MREQAQEVFRMICFWSKVVAHSQVGQLGSLPGDTLGMTCICAVSEPRLFCIPFSSLYQVFTFLSRGK